MLLSDPIVVYQGKLTCGLGRLHSGSWLTWAGGSSCFRLYLHSQTSSSAARLVGTPCRQLRLAVVCGTRLEEKGQVKRMNTMPILYSDQKTPANISHMQTKTKDFINTTQSDSSFLCKNIYSSSLPSLSSSSCSSLLRRPRFLGSAPPSACRGRSDGLSPTPKDRAILFSSSSSSAPSGLL